MEMRNLLHSSDMTIITPPLIKEKDLKKTIGYRPIVLLSCLSSVLECMVNKRIMSQLEMNNLIIKERTAFRKSRITEDQIIHTESGFQEKPSLICPRPSIRCGKFWDFFLKFSTVRVAGQMFSWTKSFLCP